MYGKYIVLVFICIIIHMLIFKRDLMPVSIHRFMDKKMKSLDSCMTPSCNTGLCDVIKGGRDSGYFLNSSDESYNADCLFTGWELSHFIFHIFLGYFYNFYVSTTISVSYEIYERTIYNCASYNDILINLFGYCIGNSLKHM